MFINDHDYIASLRFT